MLESLINPRKAEKNPWRMFFIGIIYASLSLILVKLFFSGDFILSKYSGLIVVTFCVMFSLPFMYYIIKREEQKDEAIDNTRKVWHVHQDAIYSMLFLFLGFIVAFSFWFLVLGDSSLLNAQIETYCAINSPYHGYEACISQYTDGTITGAVTKTDKLFSILENNIYVLIFTLIFSLIFGAGAIFILAWNATVIAGAISIFSKSSISQIPLGILRYMIHGVPEIAAYFITALGGGILGIGIMRHGIQDRKFYHILENVIVLLLISIGVLFVAGIMEVYLTPLFF